MENEFNRFHTYLLDRDCLHYTQDLTVLGVVFTLCLICFFLKQRQVFWRISCGLFLIYALLTLFLIGQGQLVLPPQGQSLFYSSCQKIQTLLASSEQIGQATELDFANELNQILNRFKTAKPEEMEALASGSGDTIGFDLALTDGEKLIGLKTGQGFQTFKSMFPLIQAKVQENEKKSMLVYNQLSLAKSFVLQNIQDIQILDILLNNPNRILKSSVGKTLDRTGSGRIFWTSFENQGFWLLFGSIRNSKARAIALSAFMESCSQSKMICLTEPPSAAAPLPLPEFKIIENKPFLSIHSRHDILESNLNMSLDLSPLILQLKLEKNSRLFWQILLLALSPVLALLLCLPYLRIIHSIRLSFDQLKNQTPLPLILKHSRDEIGEIADISTQIAKDYNRHLKYTRFKKGHE